MTATLAATATFNASSHDKRQAMMVDARTRFPALGLSFGYIGNLERGRDDRSCKIFTTLASWASRGGCDVSFGGYSTTNLDAFLAYAETGFEPWLIATQARLDAHDVRDLRQPAATIDGPAPRY